ncbi:Hypothetical protein AA314_06701 [Archangium gephyra]|uniref:Uncharacterized protein n=1 Tax=Archangium gephyra TaxID=48 RepID=A0AAC8QD43_9BACT|nr:Hypothetical protein AA314_06701 [Archangium gephyra]
MPPLPEDDPPPVACPADAAPTLREDPRGRHTMPLRHVSKSLAA